MLSPQNASEIAGVSRKTIMNHISNKTLAAQRNNQGRWVIDPDELQRWMDNRAETQKWNATGMPMASQETKSPTHDVVSPNTELAYAAAYEVKKAEAEMLRGRVQELEKEVSEARQEAREAWSAYRKVSDKIIDAVASQPLLLSAQYRVK
jgi:hypothetical protein